MRLLSWQYFSFTKLLTCTVKKCAEFEEACNKYKLGCWIHSSIFYIFFYWNRWPAYKANIVFNMMYALLFNRDHWCMWECVQTNRMENGVTVELLPHSSRFEPELGLLSMWSFACFPMFAWDSSWHSGFIPPSKIMPRGGVAMPNCPKVTECLHEALWWTDVPSRMYSRRVPDPRD